MTSILLRRAIAAALLSVGGTAAPASAPPLPDVVAPHPHPFAVRVTHTSNSARPAVALRDLLAERVDLAHLPPRTPITLWHDERGALVAFAVDGVFVDDGDAPDHDRNDDLVVFRTVVDDFAACHAIADAGAVLADDNADDNADDDADDDADGCVAFIDTRGDALIGDVLASPVDAWVVSSKVGERIHPITHRKRFHAGTDYAAPIGTPVVAIADGVVTASKRSWAAGRFIVLQHRDGSESKYLHLDERLVERGAHVHKGDLIGVVGKSGRVTGPHLHFELRDARGVPQDMTAARWPSSVHVDDDAIAALAARRARLSEPPLAGWPATVSAVPPPRHSDIDVGAALWRVLQALVHHG